MPRRISTTQFRSKLRQVQQQQRRAIDNYNQAVRRYNSRVKQVVSNYNQAVRAHNSRVRANRQRLKNELAKLRRHSTTTRYVVFRTSVSALHDAYTHLEQRADAQHLGPQYNQVLDLSEREAANSLGVMNSLLGIQPEPGYETAELQHPAVSDEIRKISADLESRWQGALFSLNAYSGDVEHSFRGL